MWIARVFMGYSELCNGNCAPVADALVNPPSQHDGLRRVVALMSLDRDDEATPQFESFRKANPTIDLDRFVEYFDYSADCGTGTEQSDGLSHLRDALNATARSA